MNAYIDDLFESTVIIGDSIQHGFFVLVCDGSNDGVYYYDSYSLSSSDDENNVYFIANTFDEFFIWWYHFIYTKATDIMNEKQMLEISKSGNFEYILEE